MDDSNTGNFIKERKTFFIVPDQTLIPASYLEEFLTEGYECYFIETDKNCTIDKKVRILKNIFKDSIFLFNIDYKLPDIDWCTYLKGLQTTIRPTISLGALYLKRPTLQEKYELEKTYLFDIGLRAGCIQLEYRKNANFAIIEKVLYANQAMGRRKFVRVICDSCSLSFVYNGQQFSGVVQDISLSHFSCTFPGFCPIKQYEKVENIQIKIKGIVIRSDAVLFMERMTSSGMLFIFAFTNKQGANGLDGYVKQMLIPKMYAIMSENFNSITKTLFTNLDFNTNKDGVMKQQEQREAEKLYEELKNVK